MAKRVVCALLALVSVFTLCACSEMSQVEDLLTAPTQTQEQSDIISAIETVSPDKVTLKYPITGDRRTPIMSLDLDLDDQNEAAVFFNVQTEGLYARLALLEREEDGWVISDVLDGLGTEVNSVSMLTMEDGARFMLVSWSSVNQREQILVAYHYSDGKIRVGFEENCTEMLVQDLNNDGEQEFCYITQSPEGFTLKYIDALLSDTIVSSQFDLSDDMIGSLSLTGGRLAGGKNAVFVDELCAEDTMVTEIFTIEDGELRQIALAEGLSVEQLSRRPAGMLTCRSPRGDLYIEIPTVAAPFVEVLNPDAWSYWYRVVGDTFEYMRAGFVSTEYGFMLCIPDEWLSFADVAVEETDPRMVAITDPANETILFQLRVLFVGEDVSDLPSDDYTLLAQAGSYRIYYRAACSQQDIDFILNSFIVL